jgi:hypothetical protein
LKLTRLCASNGPELLRVKGSLRNEIISQASLMSLLVTLLLVAGSLCVRVAAAQQTTTDQSDTTTKAATESTAAAGTAANTTAAAGRQDCCWSDSFHQQDRYGTDDQNRCSHRHSGFHPCHFTRASQQASGRATDTTRES